MIPVKFKPRVLRKEIGSLKCKGKTSLESSHSKQNVLWGELAEFLGWRRKSTHPLGHPNPSTCSFIWQVSTGDYFMHQATAIAVETNFFQITWKTKQDIFLKNQNLAAHICFKLSLMTFAFPVANFYHIPWVSLHTAKKTKMIYNNEYSVLILYKKLVFMTLFSQNWHIFQASHQNFH